MLKTDDFLRWPESAPQNGHSVSPNFPVASRTNPSIHNNVRANEPGTTSCVAECPFAMGAPRRTSFRKCATVDKIEDAKTPEFNKAQQRSTSYPHLIETEAAENRALLREAGIRLGHRGSRVCFQRLTGRSPVQRTGVRPQSLRLTWTSVFCVEESSSTISTTAAAYTPIRIACAADCTNAYRNSLPCHAPALGQVICGPPQNILVFLASSRMVGEAQYP
jgi:hypothetical protein